MSEKPLAIPRCSDIYRAGTLKDQQLHAPPPQHVCADCRFWAQTVRHQPMWGDCRGDVPDSHELGDEWALKPRPTPWDHWCARWEAKP